jgi:hypothetical protein
MIGRKGSSSGHFQHEHPAVSFVVPPGRRAVIQAVKSSHRSCRADLPIAAFKSQIKQNRHQSRIASNSQLQ